MKKVNWRVSRVRITQGNEGVAVKAPKTSSRAPKTKTLVHKSVDKLRNDSSPYHEIKETYLKENRKAFVHALHRP